VGRISAQDLKPSDDIGRYYRPHGREVRACSSRDKRFGRRKSDLPMVPLPSQRKRDRSKPELFRFASIAREQ